MRTPEDASVDSYQDDGTYECSFDPAPETDPLLEIDPQADTCYPLEREPIGIAPEFEKDETDFSSYKGSMSTIEREIAQWAFSKELSNDDYRSLTKVVQKGIDYAKVNAESCYISTTSFDAVKKRLKEEAEQTTSLPFEDRRVQLHEVKDIPENHRAELESAIDENAFWDVPQFDIYKSLVVDDLHQLGGAYRYLVECIEQMIKEGIHGNARLKQINKRAAMIAPFNGLRYFKNGFLMSSLKNPTYTELQSHMNIIMSCVHDIPLQAALCLRKFIDFYRLATLKEHTDETLKQMDLVLMEFNTLSPVFQNYSKSQMRFPKNHMLWKYHHDIKQYGVISGYSTTHSESQHRIDAKKPGRRTNYHKYKMTSQMAKHVYYRDLIYDQYWNFVETSVSLRPPATNIFSITRRELGSAVLKRKWLSFSEIKTKYPTYPNISSLARCCLHTMVKGKDQICGLRNMPEIQNSQVQAYQSLKLHGIDGVNHAAEVILRAHKKYHGFPRYDFAKFKDGEIGQLLLFFSVKPIATEEYPLPELVNLCLVRRVVLKDEPHASGFQVVKEPDTERVYDNYLVLPVDDITHPVHIVPDFTTALNGQGDGGVYEQYLLNHDADHHSNTRGRLPLLEDIETWMGTTSNNESAGFDNEDQAEADTDSDYGYYDSNTENESSYGVITDNNDT
ncbi:hypothetical protein BJV82DRAFT_674971 [Fennellomyces sp. T-0311]|nr:hypothetical protein BJV82DRAFT_674971 [Fennellomyces sp. T-0311]